MRLKSLPTILCASIALMVAPVRAQVGADPSDSFVSAYTAYSKAEKAESTGNLEVALTTYRDVARILDQISSRWPQWNPAIVEFRKKRTSEAIVKIQSKLGRAGMNAMRRAESIEGAGGASDHSIVEPPLPGEGNLMPLEEPSIVAPRGTRPSAPLASSGDPLEELRLRMDQLRNDLEQSRMELENVRSEKEALAKEFADSKKAQERSESQQKVLQQRADNAEAALMKALSEGAKESETVKKLQAEATKARKDLKDIQIDREAAEEVRQQLASRLNSAQNRIASLTKERDEATKLSGDAGKRIADAQKRMEAAIKEKDELNTKLTQVTSQRDDALAQVAQMKEAQKQVDRLITENTQLMAKLTEAEKQITQFKTEGVEKDKAIADLKKEVGSVTKQLADAQKQSQTYQVEMGELKAKLDDTAQQLTQVKSEVASNVGERKKMQDENDLLRGIVLRQMKEQARRDQTRKLVLDQMAKMEVKSKDLLSQINYLGQPIVKLSAKERALFKQPQIEITDTEVSIAAPRPESDAQPDQASAPAEGAAAPEGAMPAGPADAAAPPSVASELPLPVGAPDAPLPVSATESQAELALATPPQASTDGLLAGMEKSPKRSDASAAIFGNSPTGSQAGMPAELLPLVQEAKDNFERSNYRDAEKLYERILAKAPNNLYALSNLGVVRFRSGKLKLAEEAFKKAIAIAPEDAFSHCTLGIVYYSQGKYDDAVNELTKALAINPKNATAHNYLGITASQKGWQDAALKELETATTLDPNYADAHFNLAVVLATQQPPNKENARRSYKRATELGADPDNNLEALLK
jgi:Flp pilus assembly protein TadD